jgi:hypothetical protein
MTLIERFRNTTHREKFQIASLSILAILLLLLIGTLFANAPTRSALTTSTFWRRPKEGYLEVEVYEELENLWGVERGARDLARILSLKFAAIPSSIRKSGRFSLAGGDYKCANELEFWRWSF